MVILILASQELSFYERNINKNKTSHKPPNCTDKKVMINPMSFFFFSYIYKMELHSLGIQCFTYNIKLDKNGQIYYSVFYE